MKTVTLTLPYPISANRYWRPVPIGKHITIVPTKEAKQYRANVESLCRTQGVVAPITGRVHIDVKLFPNRPQDWQKRMRLYGATWDDSVMCIDIDNANKVLLDSLGTVAIEDDKWVRKLTSERMEPDGLGARVVVTITALAVQQPQAAMFEEVA